MDKKVQSVFNEMATQLSNLRLTYSDHEFVQKVLSQGFKKLSNSDDKNKKGKIEE